MDYTNTFCHLMNFEIENSKNFENPDFQDWKKRWQNRLLKIIILQKIFRINEEVNPFVIPRNHKVEEAE